MVLKMTQRYVFIVSDADMTSFLSFYRISTLWGASGRTMGLKKSSPREKERDKLTSFIGWQI